MSKRVIKSYKGTAPYIFVSYSHKDKAIVSPIIERLIKDGYRVWYDEGITPGANWPQVLAKRLGACEVCLTFISSNWLASQYCNMEIGYATKYKKAIVPVRLEDIAPPAEVDFLLTINHYIDKFVYESEDAFLEKLYEAPCMEKCKGEDGLNETPEVPVAPQEKADGRRNLSRIMVIATVGILIALIALICVLIWFGNQFSDAGDDEIGKVTPSVTANTTSERSEMSDLSGTTTAPETSVAPETTTQASETTKAPETTTQAPETTKSPETADPPVSASEGLTIKVDGIIDQGDKKVIVLSFDNQTGGKVSLGWGNTCDLFVTTDQGEAIKSIRSLDWKIEKGKCEYTFTVEDCPGVVETVVLTDLQLLNSSGLPDSKRQLNNVEIYNTGKNISGGVCSFEERSVYGITSESAMTAIPETKLQPKEGTLFIKIDGIVDQGDRKTIALSYDNRTGQTASFGWVGSSKLIITTDEDVVEFPLDELYDEMYNIHTTIKMGTESICIPVDDCPGTIERITIKQLCLLDAGLPINKLNINDAVLYDAKSNISATTCWDS